MKKLFIVFSISLFSLSFLNPFKLNADSSACETEIVTNNTTGVQYCMPESIFWGTEEHKWTYRSMVRTGRLNAEDINWLEELTTSETNQRMAILNKDWGGLWDSTKDRVSKYFKGLANGSIYRTNFSLLDYLSGRIGGDIQTSLFQAEIDSMQESYNKNYYTNSQTINNNQVYNTGSTYYTQLYNYTTNNFYDITNNTYYDVNNWYYDITNNYYTYNIDNSRHYNIYNDYTSTNVFVFNNGNEDSYKMYYRLPDGRNSYNLTEDDIKGYRTDFIIKNYDNIYDYDSLTALYHFDGNLNNSAYGGQKYLNLSKGSNTYNDSAKNFGQALFYTGDFSFNVDDGEVLDYKLMPQVSNKFSLNISDSSDSSKLLKYPSFTINEELDINDFSFNCSDYMKFEIDYEDNLQTSGYSYLLSNGPNLTTFIRVNHVSNNRLSLIFYDDTQESFTTNTFSNKGKIVLEFINNTLYYNCGNSELNTSGSYTFHRNLDKVNIYKNPRLKYSRYYVHNQEIDFSNLICLYDENQNKSYIHNLVNNNDIDVYCVGFGELINYSSGLTFVINKKFDNNVEFYENGYINNSTSYISSDDNAYYLNYNSWNHLLFVKNESQTDLYVNGIKFTTLNSNILDLNFNIKQDGYTMIDELRILNSSENFVYYGMPNLPYNTNLVYVLPKEVDTNNNILIKSIIPVNNWQIGGVRPSRAQIGDVFIYVDDFGYMKSLQQFDGNDWIAVDGALYNQTLKKWVDYNGFSIYLNDFTYQESQDITIYSITDDFSFYQWLQQEINRIISAIESISFNNVVNNNSFFPESTNLWDFLIKLMEDLINGVGEIVDKLIEFLKWLLVPSEEIQVDLQDEMDLVKQNLGFIYTPIDLFNNGIQYLANESNFNNPESLAYNQTISFSGFEYMNVMLIPPFTYSFNDLFNNSTFADMHRIYLNVIDVVCIFYVLNLARNKLERILK